MQKLSLNRNQLKYLAIAAMIIDHIAWLFVPTDSVLGFVMHFFGRLTAPIMTYFIAEGYRHTHNVKRYALRLAVFAAISWLPFVWFESGRVITEVGGLAVLRLIPQSMIFTLLICLLAVWFWDKGESGKLVKILGVIALSLVTLYSDWFCVAVFFTLNFYIKRDNKRAMWLDYCIISAAFIIGLSILNRSFTDFIYLLGLFLAPIIIGGLYNGEPGKKSGFNKWFFYIFYPGHLIILCIVREIVQRLSY